MPEDSGELDRRFSGLTVRVEHRAEGCESEA